MAARGWTFTYEDSVPYPQIRHRWKAEILRFLYVSLVWGVKVTSLLTISAQSYCFVLEYSFFANVKKEWYGDICLDAISLSSGISAKYSALIVHLKKAFTDPFMLVPLVCMYVAATRWANWREKAKSKHHDMLGTHNWLTPWSQTRSATSRLF